MTEPIETPPAPAPQFSGAMLLLGLVLSLVPGGAGNIVAGLIAMSSKNAGLAFLVGIVPGALIAALALLARRNGLRQGLLIGASIIALIGGACGASLTNTSFR